MIHITNIKNNFDIKDIKKIMLLVLVFKIMMLVLGVVFSFFYLHKNLDQLLDVGAVVNHWDANHYLSIARHGYESTGEAKYLIVFFPFYPILIKLVTLILLNATFASMVISYFATVLALYYFYKLILLDKTKSVAKRASWFLLIFPTAYFLHIGYTESLFLALMFACFYYARTKKWFLSGILALTASLTRINGVILFVPLLAELMLDYKKNKKINLNQFAILLPILGMVVYLAINHIVGGSFFIFLEYQKEHWFHQFSLPWNSIYNLFQSSINSPLTYQNAFIYWAELFAVVIGVLVSVWSIFKLRFSYSFWLLINMLIWTSSSFILSTPRYLLIAFPIYILMAETIKSKRGVIIVSVVSIIVQIFLWLNFSIGYWAF